MRTGRATLWSGPAAHVRHGRWVPAQLPHVGAVGSGRDGERHQADGDQPRRRLHPDPALLFGAGRHHRLESGRLHARLQRVGVVCAVHLLLHRQHPARGVHDALHDPHAHRAHLLQADRQDGAQEVRRRREGRRAPVEPLLAGGRVADAVRLRPHHHHGHHALPRLQLPPAARLALRALLGGGDVQPARRRGRGRHLPHFLRLPVASHRTDRDAQRRRGRLGLRLLHPRRLRARLPLHARLLRLLAALSLRRRPKPADGRRLPAAHDAERLHGRGLAAAAAAVGRPAAGRVAVPLGPRHRLLPLPVHAPRLRRRRPARGQQVLGHLRVPGLPLLVRRVRGDERGDRRDGRRAGHPRRRAAEARDDAARGGGRRGAPLSVAV
mmetsp:Transcript_14913/g.48232  ORF Transcript_14913/g.48232 Transcript_14913/m.48232 type:complete len:381 (-) Transcript_14913:114-1256(-)